MYRDMLSRVQVFLQVTSGCFKSSVVLDKSEWVILRLTQARLSPLLEQATEVACLSFGGNVMGIWWKPTLIGYRSLLHDNHVLIKPFREYESGNDAHNETVSWYRTGQDGVEQRQTP